MTRDLSIIWFKWCLYVPLSREFIVSVCHKHDPPGLCYLTIPCCEKNIKKSSFKILLATFENKFSTHGCGLTSTKVIQIFCNLFKIWPPRAGSFLSNTYLGSLFNIFMSKPVGFIWKMTQVIFG